MSAPRVWRWLSLAGGLVLLLAGVLGLTHVLTAPGGSADVAWLGAWRSTAAVAVLIGVWWMGSLRRAGGVFVLIFGLGEIAVDLFFGDLRGWAVLLLAGGLLATIGGVWAVSGRRFGALGGILAGLLLAACLVATMAGGTWQGELALLVASVLLIVVAVRLLWQPCLAPGWGLTLTVLGVAALVWLGILAMLGLADGWTLDQVRELAAWPLTLVGAWLLLTSFLRLRARTTPLGWDVLGLLAGAAAMGTGIGMLLLRAAWPLTLVGAWLLLTTFLRLGARTTPLGWNALGLLAGAAAIGTGIGMLLLRPSGSGLGLAPAAALILVALWAIWFGGWQWTPSGQARAGT